MKLITKNIALLAVFFGLVVNTLQAQEKKRIDGVIGVVGEHIILDSDIDKGFIEAKASGADDPNRTRCDLFGMLLENKLFAHHAVQDSLIVTDDEINLFIDRQVDRMVEYYGSMDNVLKYNKKKTYEEFREYYSEIVRVNKLGEAMQNSIVKDVQITPEEVRQYYNEIPKSELPIIGDEVELSEIVIKPEISKEEKQRVIDVLNQIRKEVLEDGASFTSKVFVHSEDPGSIEQGGFYQIDRKTKFVKEFKDVAFSLKEGEISEPFESDFGYHIIFLEKIDGQKLNLRHILISPKASTESLVAAREKAEKVRLSILNKEMTFAEASRSFSEEKETKANGGILLNPYTGDTKFELNRMEDRVLYSMVSNLNVNDVSEIKLISDPRSGNSQYYRIVQVTAKYDEHAADFTIDYLKIKDVALRNKKSQAIQKWLKDSTEDTYIFISDEYKDCKFSTDWVKK